MRRLQNALAILALASAAATGSLQAQADGIEIVGYQQAALRVSDLERSVAFYQTLFGSVASRHAGGATFLLAQNNQHLTLLQTGAGDVPGIAWIGIGVPDFDAERLAAKLEEIGLARIETPRLGQADLAQAERFWLDEVQGEVALFFADREGVRFRLQQAGHCSGCGVMGAGTGMLAVQGINHFTNFVADKAQANAAFMAAFGLDYLSYQGPSSPTVSLGDGRQFLMYFGSDTAAPVTAPGFTHHVSLSIGEFDVDAVRTRLSAYGLVALEGAQPQPLSHWVSLRGPERGGAAMGTPELYFADPDGIAIQIQDPSYCGGSGYLGDNCPAL